MPFDPPAAGGLAAVANMRTTLTLRLLVSSSKDKDKDKDKASAAAASQQQAATQGGAEVALDVSGGGRGWACVYACSSFFDVYS